MSKPVVIIDGWSISEFTDYLKYSAIPHHLRKVDRSTVEDLETALKFILQLDEMRESRCPSSDKK